MYIHTMHSTHMYGELADIGVERIHYYPWCMYLFQCAYARFCCLDGRRYRLADSSVYTIKS